MPKLEPYHRELLKRRWDERAEQKHILAKEMGFETERTVQKALSGGSIRASTVRRMEEVLLQPGDREELDRLHREMTSGLHPPIEGETAWFLLKQAESSSNPMDAYLVARTYYERSQFRQAIGWLDRCLAKCRSDDVWCRSLALRLRASSMEGVVAEALTLSHRLADSRGLAESQRLMAFVRLQRGDFKRSQDYYRDALISAMDGDSEGNCRDGLGRAFLGLSDFRRAREEFQAGLRAFGENVIGRANCAYGLGLASLPRQGKGGDLDAAEGALQEAKHLYWTVRNDLGMALCNQGLRDIELLRSHYKQAAALCEEALTQFKRSGVRRGAAECEAWLNRWYPSGLRWS